ncbi:MAG: hypothetical protein WBJ21_06080 [Burkholderiaceae bacterium]
MINTSRKMRHVAELDAPGWRARFARPLRWFNFVTLIAVIVLACTIDVPGIGVRAGLWMLAVFLLIPLLLAWRTGRRRRHSWRSDAILFEPPMHRPVSSLEEVQEWALPSHPLIRYPLSFLLIAMIYWALVVHQMKLPGSWLLSLVLLALVCLWCWREPLVLALIVFVGVLVVSVLGWIMQNLSTDFLLGSCVFLVLCGVIIVSGSRKRKSKTQAEQ